MNSIRRLVAKPRLFALTVNTRPFIHHTPPLHNAFKRFSSTNSKEPLSELDASPDRMIIGFTCKVCSTRSYKSMSKKAYNTGVVIIKCDGCKSKHLIADHIGWFDTTLAKPPGTIEDILREKGEPVIRKEVSRPMKFRTSDGNVIQTDDALEWLPKAIEEAEKEN